jgi:hypothetical protein
MTGVTVARQILAVRRRPAAFVEGLELRLDGAV